MFLNGNDELPNITSQSVFVISVAQLGGRHAGREGAADQTAHAGAGGDVDRNVVLLEPLDHADVRDAAGAAAAERDANRTPRGLAPPRDGPREQSGSPTALLPERARTPHSSSSDDDDAASKGRGSRLCWKQIACSRLSLNAARSRNIPGRDDGDARVRPRFLVTCDFVRPIPRGSTAPALSKSTGWW